MCGEVDVVFGFVMKVGSYVENKRGLSPVVSLLFSISFLWYENCYK